MPLPALLLSAIGLAALTYGAVIAWNSRSATTLIIVGAVLLVVAWANPVRLRASYGDASVEIDRRTEELQEALGEVVEDPDVPESAKERLGAVSETANSIARIAAATTASGSGYSWSIPLASYAPANWKTTPVDWMSLNTPLDTGPEHEFTPTSVVVRFRRSSASGAMSCTVEGPEGSVWKSADSAPSNLEVEFTFPDDFTGSSAIVPGRYKVTWFTTAGTETGHRFAGRDSFLWVAAHPDDAPSESSPT